jgi:hypothetical protein
MNNRCARWPVTSGLGGNSLGTPDIALRTWISDSAMLHQLLGVDS